jgi:hypothetical protein
MTTIEEKQSLSGSRCIKSGFLWWPKNIGGKVKWLRRAAWVEEYMYQFGLFSALDEWVPVKWVEETP